MNVTNMKMEKLRVLCEKPGRLASGDTQSMSIYKGCFPAPHHLLEINTGSGKKRTSAISDFKCYDVRATEKNRTFNEGHASRRCCHISE